MKLKPSTADRLKEALADIGAEAAGVYELVIVTPRRVLDMVEAAVTGDREAARYLNLLDGCVRRIDEDRPLCVTCDREFSARRMPLCFAILHAGRDDAKTALLHMVCAECARPGLQERLLEFYRKNLIGELRVLPPPAASSATRH